MLTIDYTRRFNLWENFSRSNLVSYYFFFTLPIRRTEESGLWYFIKAFHFPFHVCRRRTMSTRLKHSTLSLKLIRTLKCYKLVQRQGKLKYLLEVVMTLKKKIELNLTLRSDFFHSKRNLFSKRKKITFYMNAKVGVRKIGKMKTFSIKYRNFVVLFLCVQCDLEMEIERCGGWGRKIFMECRRENSETCLSTKIWEWREMFGSGAYLQLTSLDTIRYYVVIRMANCTERKKHWNKEKNIHKVWNHFSFGVYESSLDGIKWKTFSFALTLFILLFSI